MKTRKTRKIRFRLKKNIWQILAFEYKKIIKISHTEQNFATTKNDLTHFGPQNVDCCNFVLFSPKITKLSQLFSRKKSVYVVNIAWLTKMDRHWYTKKSRVSDTKEHLNISILFLRGKVIFSQNLETLRATSNLLKRIFCRAVKTKKDFRKKIFCINQLIATQ